jgi:outer membrane protein assembly factor BamA
MRLTGLSVRYIVLPVLIAQLLTSCSNTRYLTGDQVLLRKNEVTIQSEIDYRKIRRNIEENLSLEGKLASLAKQQPNTRTLGLFRLNLTIYNRYYTTEQKGFYHWLITTIGEPPVLFDSTLLTGSAQLMHEFMVSKGYLLPDVKYTYTIKRKKATPHFFVSPGPLYTIDTVYFPHDSSRISAVIDSAGNETILKKSDAFDADILGEEQLRLFRELQNRGYYRFLRSYLYFEADTFNSTRTVNIYVRLQNPATAEDTQRFTIRNIYVFPDYDPQQELQSSHHDTVVYNGNFFIDAASVIKPEVLSEAIFINRGLLYSRKDYDYSLNRLADLGVFKFISIRFEEKPGRFLDCMVYLTPAKKHAMTTEVEASNIEDNVGGAIRLSFKDKNVLHGANQLDASLNAGNTNSGSQQRQSHLQCYGPGEFLSPTLRGAVQHKKFFEVFQSKNKNFVDRKLLPADKNLCAQ